MDSQEVTTIPESQLAVQCLFLFLQSKPVCTQNATEEQLC